MMVILFPFIQEVGVSSGRVTGEWEVGGPVYFLVMAPA